MLVKDIMTRDVKTIQMDSSIQEAAKLMSEFSVGCLVVVENNLLRGIITERDILNRVVSANKNATETKISEVMTKDVIYVEPDLSVEDAAEVMVSKRIKKLPVVYKNQLVGILTAMDIVAAQPKMMEQIANLIVFSKRKKFVAG